ncbi:MAG: manganese efflux pump MntP family protein [Clostridia bacterium]|nr:manganese efflux pump MntP family protein [Clostridia bacterium]
MSFAELFFLAVALSMDAFAISICAGLAAQKAVAKKALIVALHFGVFQALMPIIGYVAATQFADSIMAYGHWIAFAVLCFLGGKMIIGSLQQKCEKQIRFNPVYLLPLAVGTSIDALATGVSFAFLGVSIVEAVLLIGVTTFVISMAGVYIGRAFGARFQSKAELAGGIVLILIGLKILLDYTLLSA